MKVLRTIILATTVIIMCCAPGTQAQQQTKPVTSIKSPTITYNPDTIAREEVISAITDVFAARGYKTTLGRQAGVKFGANTVTPFEEGPIRYVTTESQPPIEGSNGKQWFYRAIIEDRSVEIQVFLKVPPYKFGPVTLDSELTSWEPPDVKLVLQEIQKRLVTK